MTTGKRIISAILSLAMVASFSTVFAGAANTETRAKAQELMAAVADKEVKAELSTAKIAADVEVFEDKMIETERLSIYEVNEDGHVVYSYLLYDDTTVDYIDTWVDEEGGTCLRFNENGLTNILCFKPDGSIYMDGVKIEVVTTSDPIADREILTNIAGGIEPMANAYSYFSMSPFGNTTFSQYSSSGKMLYDSTGITKLANAISKVGVGAVVALVTNVWGSIVAKLGQVFFKEMITNAVVGMINTDPSATTIKFVDYRRPHPSNDTLRMMYRHDHSVTSNSGKVVTKYYYEDRRAT